MRVKRINPRVVHLIFKDNESMAGAMVRFQEFYESVEFKGKVFTLGQFRDWYSKTHDGYTYAEDWDGFNVPSSVLDIFRTGLFDPLSKEEQEILKKLPASGKPFYVIATSGESSEYTLDHELVHAQYYLSPEYRNEVNSALLEELEIKGNTTEHIRKYLIGLGYSEHVMLDELNAYIVADSAFLEKEGFRISNHLYEKLDKLHEKYIDVAS